MGGDCRNLVPASAGRQRGGAMHSRQLHAGVSWGRQQRAGVMGETQQRVRAPDEVDVSWVGHHERAAVVVDTAHAGRLDRRRRAVHAAHHARTIRVVAEDLVHDLRARDSCSVGLAQRPCTRVQLAATRRRLLTGAGGESHKKLG